MSEAKVRGLLIRGGRIVDPSQGIDAVGELLLLDGRVAALRLGGGLAAPQETPVLEAGGLVVAPGFVDLHCHLREPGFEEKETIATGTLAAARGGFTTVCCMPNTQPPVDCRAVVDFIEEKARDEGVVRVLPIGAVSKGRAGRELVEMEELAEGGVVGFSDDGSPVADADVMRRALTTSLSLGLPVIDHCEEPSLSGGVMHEGEVATRLGLRGIPAAAEESMVARDIALAELTGGRLHIAHVSTAGSVVLIREARERGLAVTAEVTPHHLTLTHEWVARQGDGGARRQQRYRYDTNTKVNPPLGGPEDVEALIEGLRRGVIDAIATDHAPHAAADKTCSYEEAAFGISGFETALASLLSLVYQGRMPLTALVERLTWGPARIIDRHKIGIGTLRAGAPADLTLFDPELEWQVDVEAFQSKGKNSPLHGRPLKGKVVATVFGGVLVHKEGMKGDSRGP